MHNNKPSKRLPISARRSLGIIPSPCRRGLFSTVPSGTLETSPLEFLGAPHQLSTRARAPRCWRSDLLETPLRPCGGVNRRRPRHQDTVRHEATSTRFFGCPSRDSTLQTTPDGFDFAQLNDRVPTQSRHTSRSKAVVQIGFSTEDRPPTVLPGGSTRKLRARGQSGRAAWPSADTPPFRGQSIDQRQDL